MPALIERVRPPLGLRGLQATDLIDWDGSDDAAAIRQLISDITAMMQAHGTPRTQPEPISAGVTASLSPVLALLACTPVQPPGATAPAPSAISTAGPAATAPVPLLSFDNAVQAAASTLFSTAQLAPETSRPATLVIDPLINGTSAEQSAATHSMESRIGELLKARYPQFDVLPFSAARVAKSPIVLVGTFKSIISQGQTAGNREAYRVCLALGDLRTGKIIAKGSTRARMDGVDATPTSYFRDSPAWMMERATDGYIKTCQGTKVDDPINHAYLDGILVAGLVRETIKAYELGRYRESLDLHSGALGAPSGDKLRVYNGIYLANTKLGRRDAATEAFAKIVDYGPASKRLAMKFLFNPGSTAFMSAPAVSASYPIWLQQIARRSSQGNACLEIGGHTSRTGPEPLSERLSLLRVEFIKHRLVEQAPTLGKRLITTGVGSRDTLIGTGRDDLADALDRRVVLIVIDC